MIKMSIHIYEWGFYLQIPAESLAVLQLILHDAFLPCWLLESRKVDTMYERLRGVTHSHLPETSSVSCFIPSSSAFSLHFTVWGLNPKFITIDVTLILDSKVCHNMILIDLIQGPAIDFKQHRTPF